MKRGIKIRIIAHRSEPGIYVEQTILAARKSDGILINDVTDLQDKL